MPSYLVWQPEAGQTDTNGMRVRAHEAGAAAEMWADADDYASAEYHIVQGHPAAVMVRDVKTGETTEWVVVGESVRRYTATRSAAPAGTSLRQGAP